MPGRQGAKRNGEDGSNGMDRTNKAGETPNPTKSNQIKPNQTSCGCALRKPRKGAKCAEGIVVARFVRNLETIRWLDVYETNSAEFDQIRLNPTSGG